MNGEQLRRIREDMGMTQPQMAVKADVSLGTITALELGTLRPTPRTKRKLSVAYGVKPEQIQSERKRKAIAA